MEMSYPWLEEETQNQVTFTYSELDNSDCLETLENMGFIIVSDVFSENNCQNFEKQFLQELKKRIDSEQMTPQLENKLNQIDDLFDWPHSSIPGLVSKGFCGYYGMPQSKYAWEIRSSSKIQSIYRKLLFGHDNEQDLSVSLDLPFFLPKNNKNSSVNQTPWPHVDQNNRVDNIPSYQGCLYVSGYDKGHLATTVIQPRSNQEVYPQLEPYMETKKHGFYLSSLPSGVKEEYENQWNEKARLIPVNSGSLLIWDSKTLHQGYPVGSRLAMPVSYQPQNLRKQRVYQQKLDLVQKGGGTNHWPIYGKRHPASVNRFPRKAKEHQKWSYTVFPMKTEIDVPDYQLL